MFGQKEGREEHLYRAEVQQVLMGEGEEGVGWRWMKWWALRGEAMSRFCFRAFSRVHRTQDAPLWRR